MNASPARARPALALSLAAALSLAGIDARAQPSKRACAAAYERAQGLRRDGKLIAAREALIACSQPTCPAAAVADCGPWLAEVEKSLPSVVIAARDAGGRERLDVRVLVDGRLLAAALDGKALPVDPGPHTFRYEPAGGPAVEERVLIREGEKNRAITVILGAPPGGAPPSPRPIVAPAAPGAPRSAAPSAPPPGAPPPAAPRPDAPPSAPPSAPPPSAPPPSAPSAPPPSAPPPSAPSAPPLAAPSAPPLAAPSAPPLAAPATPPPAAPAAPSAPPAVPPLAWVAGGVGVAGLGVFAVVGALSLDAEAELRATCAPRCLGDDVRAIRVQHAVADVGLGVGVVALGAAAWLYLTRPAAATPPPARASALRPALRPLVAGASAGVEGTF
ncbi:hypothetical protein [Sorangium sp. So ce1182]|uniref:hypothetical protein n=1 Tax=Sorangium sp. So ce1182 TaxID=3133334 RepID=UPI003F5DDF79